MNGTMTTATTLPEKGTPLILADGTQIDPSTGRPVGAEEIPQFVKVPSTRAIREEYAQTRKRLEDLPVPTGKMNAFSVIVTYKMLGVSDRDICVATGITEQQLGAILLSDEFSDLKQMIVDNIYSQDADVIRASMKDNALMGVQRLQQLINSEDEAIALNASKDAMDRDGYRPADVVEHRHKMDGGLVIEVIKRDETQKIDDMNVKFDNIIDIESEEDNDY